MELDKIGIFASVQHGDVALCTAILKYANILWPNKKIVWYCDLTPEKATYTDMLKFNDAIYELRPYPDFITMENFRSCIDKNGQLNLYKRAEFDSMKDLHNGYFPAPWAVLPSPHFEGVNYSNIPRQICGADPSWEWHPYLGFSDEEREMARDFHSKLPHAKTIMLETELRSAGNFRLNDNLLRDIMRICRSKFGKCNFIFASKVDYSHLVDDPGVVSCSHFTVRQTALIHNYCDLFIGVCSGITMTASCWGNAPVPRVELCGEIIQSSTIANGPVYSVLCDRLSPKEMDYKFKEKITEVVNKF